MKNWGTSATTDHIPPCFRPDPYLYFDHVLAVVELALDSHHELAYVSVLLQRFLVVVDLWLDFQPLPEHLVVDARRVAELFRQRLGRGVSALPAAQAGRFCLSP